MSKSVIDPSTFSKEEISEYLGEIPLFSHLSDSLKKEVSKCLNFVSFEPLTNIVTQGEAGDQFFILLNGYAEVLVNDKKVADLEALDYFGEKSLLTQEPRNATVRSKTNVACLRMHSDDFKVLVEREDLNLNFAKREAIISASIPKALETSPHYEEKPEALRNFLLKKTPFCLFSSHLSAEQKKEIVLRMQKVEAKKDDVLIREGAYGSEMFVIENGIVEVSRLREKKPKGLFNKLATLNFSSTKKEKKNVLASLGSGEYFGELAMLYKCPRNATITASTDCTLWSISNADFRSVLRDYYSVEMAERVKFLKTVPVFGSLLVSEFNTLARSLEQTQFIAGTEIIKQGEEGDSFFLVKTGVVQVEKDGATVKELGKGDFFGERALIKKEVRNATCRAKTEVYCFVLNKALFSKLLGPLEEIMEKRTSGVVKRPESKQDFQTLSLKKGLREFILIETLGRGAFGTVKLAWHKETRKFVALKAMKVQEIDKANTSKHLQNEKKCMEEAWECPWIARFYGSFLHGFNVVFVLELASGGELFNLLRKKGLFKETEARFYAAQVVLAFKYLHERGIVYRDLKPENIVLTDSGYVKVIDLGFAKKLVGNENTYTLCGTPDYLAPEVITGGGHSRTVDLWCLGVLLYELNAGYPPFRAPDEISLFTEILHSKVNFPTFFSKDLKDIVEKLLQKKPMHRIGAGISGIQEVIDHPYFQKLNWEELKAKKIKPEFVPSKNDVEKKKEKALEKLGEVKESTEKEYDLKKLPKWAEFFCQDKN